MSLSPNERPLSRPRVQALSLSPNLRVPESRVVTVLQKDCQEALIDQDVRFFCPVYSCSADEDDECSTDDGGKEEAEAFLC